MNPWRASIWSVNLLLVGAIAYSAAITTTHVIERYLRAVPPPPAEERRPSERVARQSSVPMSAYQEVLDRNIFGARRSTPERQSVRAVAKDAPASAPEPVRLMLTGTFVAGLDSFAMVIAQGERQERLYRVGDCVPVLEDHPNGRCTSAQAKLATIELDRIFVMKGGKRIPVEIGKGPPPEPQRAAAQEPNRPSRLSRTRSRVGTRPTISPPAGEEGDTAEEEPNDSAGEFPSERVGNTYQVTVPNAEVEKAFENFSEIAGQAAAVPIIENGEAQGFQLRKIRRGSIFERLGLKNYDLIRGVNGESLTTADQALRLFTLFRNEREIVLDVKRRDEELTFSYTVE